MTSGNSTPSERQQDLLERAYHYALEHGLAELSLRPLASAIGSSPRVLLYLFGSKDGLVRALLTRARADELALLQQVRDLTEQHQPGLKLVAEQVWSWLLAEERQPLLTLWVEGYSRSLISPEGPWGEFARNSVTEWLTVLAAAQPPEHRDTTLGRDQRSLVLAVLRGALLDLLATGEKERITPAVHTQLATLDYPRSELIDTTTATHTGQ